MLYAGFLRLAALLLLLPQVTLVWAGPTEQALITSYYQSILRRAPDPGGLAYWDSEATRLRDAGQDAKEAFIAMSSQFFDSAEYRGFNRNNAAFLTDAYLAFFQRAPDSGGLAYWQGQLAQGLPRGIVLAGFQFSAEFSSYIDARLGVGSARIEGTVIVDFYRGYLNRLPDGAGLAYWIAQFRAAQCRSAVDLYNSADAISSQFLGSGEYASRARSDADFVADLYSAFLRRGGDLAGAQYWIELLRTGTSRDAVRRAFLDSPEFRARLAAVMAAGCYVVPTVVDADVWRLLQQATFGPIPGRGGPRRIDGRSGLDRGPVRPAAFGLSGQRLHPDPAAADGRLRAEGRCRRCLPDDGAGVHLLSRPP